MSETTSRLLYIFEHGGIPVYPRDLQQRGYEVISVTSIRKAMSEVKKDPPDLIVAEFNMVSTFRDRISNLESLLARCQISAPKIRVVVVYEPIYLDHLNRIRERFTITRALPMPVSEQALYQAVDEVTKHS